MKKVKGYLKSIFSLLLPKYSAAFLAAKARAHSHKLIKKWGYFDLNQRLIKELGNKVVFGPFQGLILTQMTFDEHIGPFLLGTYEIELHPWIYKCIENKYSQILDIGGKFGYYAVGLARKFPNAHVIAFDIDWWAKKAMAEMCLVNNVNNLTVAGFCDTNWLKSNLSDHALVICDIDGFEKELFCSEFLRVLCSATLIIETHDCIVPGTLSAIVSRYKESHNIEIIESRTTPIMSNEKLGMFTHDEIAKLSNEVRPKQAWILLTPKGE